jgi:hypothetical protein
MALAEYGVVAGICLEIDKAALQAGPLSNFRNLEEGMRPPERFSAAVPSIVIEPTHGRTSVTWNGRQ